MSTSITRASSLLFVPSIRPDRFPKALESGAGAVILDLEDAVSPDQKEAAREELDKGLAALSAPQLSRILVRINASDSPWYAQDVRLVSAWVERGMAGVMMPKADSASSVQSLAASLGDKAQIIPLIESLAGLDAVDLIARAPQVARLAFGHLDFQIDLGMRCSPEESELTSVRLAIVMASRRAGLPSAVDGVTTATDRSDVLLADVQRSRRLGFGAKLCIHPAQVADIKKAFTPTTAEVDWARRVIEIANTGVAVFKLDGRMVDAPVIELARRTILLAEAG